jgi:FkbM family methyltransferase
MMVAIRLTLKHCSIRHLAVLITILICFVLLVGFYLTNWFSTSTHNRTFDRQQPLQLTEHDVIDLTAHGRGLEGLRGLDTAINLRQKSARRQVSSDRGQVVWNKLTDGSSQREILPPDKESKAEHILDTRQSNNNKVHVQGLSASEFVASHDVVNNRKLVKIPRNRTSTVLRDRLHKESTIVYQHEDLHAITHSRTSNDLEGHENSSVLRSQLQDTELHGGPGHCHVYNTRQALAAEFEFDESECVKLKTRPTVILCPYRDSDDRHLSQPIRTHHIWEPHIVALFQRALQLHSTAGVYDIGANIGQYTLLAATMGRRVVAVEPFINNLHRLHKAIHIARLSTKITVVKDAVSDVRDTFELEVKDGDPAAVRLTSQDADRYCDEPDCPPHAMTIYLDDLLEVTNFETAIMKIDVEGYEHRAFVHADQLLTEVNIPFIFMEWTRMRQFYGSEVDDTNDKRLVQRMVDKLTRRGYKAYSIADEKQLNVSHWFGWPNDIVWISDRRQPKPTQT